MPSRFRKYLLHIFNFQFSQNGSVGLSRQDSGGSLPVAKATKKTSRTNLSEASADTGIIGDIDNKVKLRHCKKATKFEKISLLF